MSIEGWRRACADSQARADHQRHNRRTIDHARHIAIAVTVWLALGLLAWWILT